MTILFILKKALLVFYLSVPVYDYFCFADVNALSCFYLQSGFPGTDLLTV